MVRAPQRSHLADLGLPIEGTQGWKRGSDRRVDRGSDRRVDRGGPGITAVSSRIASCGRCERLGSGSEHFSAHSNCNTLARWFKSGACNHRYQRCSASRSIGSRHVARARNHRNRLASPSRWTSSDHRAGLIFVRARGPLTSMNGKVEWAWEFPGNMGIGFSRAGTGSGWQACSGAAHRIFSSRRQPPHRSSFH